MHLYELLRAAGFRRIYKTPADEGWSHPGGTGYYRLEFTQPDGPAHLHAYHTLPARQTLVFSATTHAALAAFLPTFTP